jgi:predicted O-linked N-acetylglucosamine transferase (SPINDLY family)
MSNTMEFASANTHTPVINLFQIAYSPESLAVIQPGFAVLDNMRNEQPSWFEYWPIRRFLLNEALDDNAYYAFFSPLFSAKTGLGAAQVRDFVERNQHAGDVFIFSPQPDMGAFFLNVFEQAETLDQGMIATYQAIASMTGFQIPIEDLIMDSRQVVFSNYFVAKPAFWRIWLSINEIIYNLAEDPANPVGKELCAPTNYRTPSLGNEPIQRKVFLQERTASFILSMDSRWKGIRYDAFKTVKSISALARYELESVMSDALKIAYRETRDDKYIATYFELRAKLQEALAGGKDVTDLYKPPEPQSLLRLTLEETVSAAEALASAGRVDEACRIYEAYIASPADQLQYVGLHNLAVLLHNQGKNEKAEKYLRSSLQINPAVVIAYLNLGTLLEAMGRPFEAIASWEDGLAIEQDDTAEARDSRIKLLNNIGRLKEIQRDYAAAEAALSESLFLDQDQASVMHHWIHLRQKQCQWPVLANRVSRDDLVKYASPLTILSLSDDPAEQLACVQRYAREKIGQYSRMVPTSHRYKHDKLRIGYLSSDLSMHAVSLLTVELYEEHNRDAVEVHAFCWSREDGTPFRTRVKRAFDKFHIIKDIDDAAAAELIRKNEIDVLIDLQGLSANARPNIIARGPAPIQIQWLGYPGPSGISNNDYVLADDFTIPGELEPFFTETPLRLPTVFQVCDTTRRLGASKPRSFYGLPDDAFVFCAFNNNYKITPEMFDSWLRILNDSPDSILWLLQDNDWSRDNLLARCIRSGLDSSRVYFAGRIDPADYLSRFQVADLFLDTTPYNAGTTANDALWAGLPLLTLSGRTYVARMAGSLLRSAGLNELITHERADYEKTAIHYANNRAELERLREHLKAEKESGRLFNTKRFVSEFEAALKDIYKG